VAHVGFGTLGPLWYQEEITENFNFFFKKKWGILGISALFV
jgi:hypothetical protein